jgi:hypothetical protein
MPTATLNLRVTPRRMLRAKEAGEYCGLPTRLITVSTVQMPNGKQLYDIRDLDDFLDGLKNTQPHDDEDIIRRLGL